MGASGPMQYDAAAQFICRTCLSLRVCSTSRCSARSFIFMSYGQGGSSVVFAIPIQLFVLVEALLRPKIKTEFVKAFVIQTLQHKQIETLNVSNSRR